MGTPLIAVGAFGASAAACRCMDEFVRAVFGTLMLAMGWYIATPLLPPAAVHCLGWAALLLVVAIHLHALDPAAEECLRLARKLWKGWA